MKPKSYVPKFIAGVGAAIIASSSASAQLTWDANDVAANQTDGAGGWLDAGHWWDGTTNVDWTSGSNAIFGNSGSAGSVGLAAPTAVGSLTFNTFSGTYSLGTSGQAFTINSGITKNAGSGPVTFVGPVILGGAQTWTNNSTGLLLTGNGTNLITNGGHQLTIDGSGNTTFGVVNNSAVTLSGSGALVKNGTGLLSIGGNNSAIFSGNVTINDGVLHYGDFPGSLGTGNITITNGMLESRWSSGVTRTQGSGAGEIQITGGESGFALNGNTSVTFNIGAITWGSATFNPTKFLLQNDRSQSNSNLTLSSTINLNGANRTIVVSGGSTGAARAILSGAISNSTGTAGLIKEGNGMLNLTNNTSAWNGNTTVSGGILDFGGINLSNIGGGSGRNISLAEGAGVRFNSLNNAVLNRIVETTSEITIMTGSFTSGTIDLSSSAGATLPNAFLGNWASNGAMANISGTATITPGSDGYKFGSAASNGKLGIAISLADVGGATKLTVGGGRVQLTGDNTFTGESFVRDGARLMIGNANALQNSPLNTGTSTNTGVITFANGAAGGTTPGAQTVPNAVIGGLTGSRDLSSMINQGSATATANGNAGNNSPTLALNSITGITLNPGSGLSHTYSGAIGNVTGSATAFTLTMASTAVGTQELTAVNTYTGSTSINGGTLLISGSGSINSSSGITIDGGNLRYNSSVALASALTFTSGTISGTNLTGASFDNQVISTGKTISPGNSPGTMNVGSQEWAGGGTYVWEINNVSGTAGADPGWDLLSGTGILTISATDLNPFNILLTSLDMFNNAGDAANFSDGGSYAWMIADFNGEITTFSTDAFALNTSAFSNDFTGNFEIVRGDASGAGGDNTQIWITYTAIPEPHTAILSVIGVLLLLRRKRA